MSQAEVKWTTALEVPVECDRLCFGKGVYVWSERPHVLNKRLSVASHMATIRCDSNTDNERYLSLVSRLYVSLRFPDDFSDLHDVEKWLSDNLQTILSERNGGDSTTLSFTLQELLPRNHRRYRHLYQIIIEDESLVIYVPFDLGKDGSLQSPGPNRPYAFEYVLNEPRIRLLIYDDGSESELQKASVAWLSETVLPKIRQWSIESLTDCKILPSLSQIPTKKYVSLYQSLKSKYGPQLVQIWPEKTDPLKFVYEDIAIAAYLLILWEQDRKPEERLQSFVDLGCGNGLLAHILSSEGHTGTGVDVKRRKIWDLYGSGTKLVETAIVPSCDTLYPEFDWIIGNHSDELTPWIPVIAARSSQTAKFFVLPCCAHNFNAKYQRRKSNVSQYEEYIDFVTEVAKTCGFKTMRDKLRIPSTKRTCVIGAARSYSASDWPEVDQNIAGMIRRECGAAGADDSWATNFNARPAEQVVRNCTLVAKEVQSSIVALVVDLLLKSSDNMLTVLDSDRKWRTGGCLRLSQLAAKIPADLLGNLRSECGGLQTLLRNHYHVFQVVKGDVTLRNYSISFPVPKRRKRTNTASANLKTKMCWFHFNHPDGCPIASGENCQFAHQAIISQSIKPR